MKNPSLLTDDELRQLLLESAGIIDSLFQKLHKKDAMLLAQQDTIDELAQRCERYNSLVFGSTIEKPEVSE